MTDRNREEFGELAGVADLLGRIDPSVQSRVKASLKARLLSRAAEKAEHRPYARLWLVPAFAAALAVFFIATTDRRRAAQAPEYSPFYAIPSDGCGESGRGGLGDYLSAERF